MATRHNPRFKECRRLGVNVCGHPKAMNRTSQTMRRTRKLSEYGQQLIEKQKIKAYYGLMERQLLRYFKNALKSKGRTGESLILSLECRLDNLVYRMGFANSIRMARQMVNHGHFLVDGKKVNIPSCAIKVGQEISLKESDRKNIQFSDCFLKGSHFIPNYVEIDQKNFSGKLVNLPPREEIPIEVDDQMVVGFYTK